MATPASALIHRNSAAAAVVARIICIVMWLWRYLAARAHVQTLVNVQVAFEAEQLPAAGTPAQPDIIIVRTI